MTKAMLNRKLLLLLAFGILLAAPAGLVVGSASKQNEGYQPAGSRVWETNFVMPGSVPALVTFYKGGAATVSEGFMFLTLTGGKISPLHGVWKRTSPKSLDSTSLYMRYNLAGTLVGFSRTRSALRFADDPDYIEWVMYIENGLPCASPPFGCPDPLSP